MALYFEKENIIDPILERIDPTPNIHQLFMQFNKRFFWGKLDMVEVAWSGRQMTSCAGICSFHPRSRHCMIKLSAPLLSLRSRKDMVETLLHEMIHAFLFMTNNNRDREDHGPMFHEHMYRINKETGTNISVYHTFNDEVRHFQGHVWRCNGPCQKMSPFFGLVRRASNRAPGPNDKWWSSHKIKCNGQFEKIEEPPGYKSKKGGKSGSGASKGNAKDIRSFFTPGKSPISNIHTLGNTSSQASPPMKSGDSRPNRSGNHSSNIHTLNGNLSKFGSNPPKSNFSGNSSSSANTNPTLFGSKPPKFNSSGKLGGLVSNKGGTVVVFGKTNQENSKPPSKTFIDNVKPSTFVPKTQTPKKTTSTNKPTLGKEKPSFGTSQSKGPIEKAKPTTFGPKLQNPQKKSSFPGTSQPAQSTLPSCVQEQMRKVWGNLDNTNKRKQSENEESNNKKIILQCENCDSLVDENDMVSHRLACPPKKALPCPVCNRAVQDGELEGHLSECLSDSITEDMFAEDEATTGIGDSVDCPVCASSVPEVNINTHVDECLNLQAIRNGF